MPRQAKKSLWELYIPTMHPDVRQRRFSRAWHAKWEQRVLEVAGGMGKFAPATGLWVSPAGSVVLEAMVPVRIVATRTEIDGILRMTCEHYAQEVVMCHRLSSEVLHCPHPSRKGPR